MLRSIILAVGLSGIMSVAMGASESSQLPKEVGGRIQLYHMMSLISPPSIEQSLYGLQNGLKFGGSTSDGNKPGIDEFIDDYLIEMAASILHWYPRANFVMVGRDMWFFADCLESLIMQLDLDAQVTRLGASRPTFGLVDERYHKGGEEPYDETLITNRIRDYKDKVIAMLDDAGINRESVEDRPHVFMDGCNNGRGKVKVYAKQPRIIMGSLFEHLVESGMAPDSLVEKIQFVGLSNQELRDPTSMYNQRFLERTPDIWEEQRKDPKSIYTGEFNRFPYARLAGNAMYWLGVFLGDDHPWHKQFGPISEVDGVTFAQPTVNGTFADKLIHLKLQRYVWDKVARRIDRGNFPELPPGYSKFSLKKRHLAGPKALRYKPTGRVDGEHGWQPEYLEEAIQIGEKLGDEIIRQEIATQRQLQQILARAKKERALDDMCRRFAISGDINDEELEKLLSMSAGDLARRIAKNLSADELCGFLLDETRDMDIRAVKREIAQILVPKLDEVHVDNIQALNLSLKSRLFGNEDNERMALLGQLLKRIQARTPIDHLLRFEDPEGYTDKLKEVLPEAILWARKIETFEKYAEHIKEATGHSPFWGVDRELAKELAKAFFERRDVEFCKKAVATIYADREGPEVFRSVRDWMRASASTHKKDFRLKGFLEISEFKEAIKRHKKAGVSWKALIELVQDKDDADALRELINVQPDQISRRPRLWGTNRRIKARLQKLKITNQATIASRQSLTDGTAGSNTGDRRAKSTTL